MKRLLLVCLLLLLTPPAFAASVNISTIAVAGSTVTVTTASPHGLAVNSGFCLSAPASVCTVAETVPTSTTLTFTQPSTGAVAICSSACGTGSPAPRIVILDVSAPNAVTQTINARFWLTTTKPVARPGTVSAWTATGASAGATAAENSALAAGSFREEVPTNMNFPATMTSAQIQAALIADYNAKQAALAGNTQPGAFYGTVYDGSAWGVQ